MKILKISLIGLMFLLVMAPAATNAGCGDLNLDGVINLLDILEFIQVKFHGDHIYPPPPPIPMELGDINGSNSINLLDIIGLIDYQFKCHIDCEQLLNCPVYDHQDVSGDCMDGDGDEEVIFEVNGTGLTVYHNNAYYNCCLDYFVDYGIRGGVIAAYERDFGDFCDCYCNFNLSSSLNDIEPGIYIVRFYNIEGDLLKEETVTFTAAPQMINSAYDGCLDNAKGSIIYEYIDNILRLAHIGMEFNCSAELDGIGIEFAMSGDTLRFFETNLSDQGAFCVCDYNLTAEVAGIGPGTYIAEIYSQDFAEESPILRDRRELTLE